MKIVLLDADTLGGADLSEFHKLGDFTSYGLTDENQTYERVKNADIIMTNKVILTKDLLQKLPQLKLIAVTATGTNIIDMEYCKNNNIEVRNVAGYSTKSVAQHTLTMALNLLSQIAYYDHFCKNGNWAKSASFTHIAQGLHNINEKKWGIIGLGDIGKEVARLADTFGCELYYHSVSGTQQNVNYTMLTLQDLLQTCDIISIHSPLTPKTSNLIQKKELLLLKEGAILINSGRGGIVNEEDLSEVLENKNIFFGTDVLEKEPMRENHPFLNPKIQHKILITPHIAWGYDQSRKQLIKKVFQNIKSFLEK